MPRSQVDRLERPRQPRTPVGDHHLQILAAQFPPEHIVGTRELLAFTRAKSESKAGWEGLLIAPVNTTATGPTCRVEILRKNARRISYTLKITSPPQAARSVWVTSVFIVEISPGIWTIVFSALRKNS